VDIAVVMNNRYFTQAPEMLVEVLYNEPIEVLMAASHPLALYDRVPWPELICYPQVVFKDGYGMQRMVQEQFGACIGAKLHAVLELNTLDAFRGVVRQGELIALLPHSALVEAKGDRTLAIRSIAQDRSNSKVSAIGQSAIDPTWTREVVLVTTHDRMQIPPIAHFWNLVRECVPPFDVIQLGKSGN
jgi:DNA-binding transcriptional LysR family regulator